MWPSSQPSRGDRAHLARVARTTVTRARGTEAPRPVDNYMHNRLRCARNRWRLRFRCDRRRRAACQSPQSVLISRSRLVAAMRRILLRSLLIEQTCKSESPILCSFLYGTIISDRLVGLHTHRAFARPYEGRGRQSSAAHKNARRPARRRASSIRSCFLTAHRILADAGLTKP